MAEKVKQYRLPDDPITLDELKSFLWAAATHLRGQYNPQIEMFARFKMKSSFHKTKRII